MTRVTEQNNNIIRKGAIETGKSLSYCQGKGSISHNNRSFNPKNVDQSRTKNNVTFVKQPIAEAYSELFDEAVKLYNLSQKRADRKKDECYYREVFKHEPCNTVITASDKRKSFYEDLVQIGSREDTAMGTPDGELAAKCLTEYMNGFQERNPNFHVFNAVLHMDEATPHLHIDYIPIGHYNRGVSVQNGLAKALEEMGYGKGEHAIDRWRQAERDVLKEICSAHGIEIETEQKSRGTLDVETYKKYIELDKKNKELDMKISDKERKGSDLDAQNAAKAEQLAELNREIEQAVFKRQIAVVNAINVPPQPEKPIEPREYYYTAGKEGRERKKAIKEFEKAKKAYPDKLKAWEIACAEYNSLYAPVEAVRAVAKQQERLKAYLSDKYKDLTKREAEIPEIINAGVADKLAKSERYADNMRVTQSFKARYETMIGKPFERGDDNDSKPLAKQQERSNAANSKQINRDR